MTEVGGYADRCVEMAMLWRRGRSGRWDARARFGTSVRSHWSEEVRRRCGQELLGRGMFPPSKYQNLTASPTRRGLPCSVEGTRVLVDRR